MKKLKALLLVVVAVFAVMVFPETVNAVSVCPVPENLNNGPVTVQFYTVEDPDFEDGYIYHMTYTAPEAGWYNVTANGAMGLVLGLSEEQSEYEDDFYTYKNDTTTFREPVLAYKDEPYRAGAVCSPVYLEKGEKWDFSVIGTYYGSSQAANAKFEVKLVYKVPKITGVSVNKTTVRPGEKVIYSITFDQNVENWGFTDVNISENIYGPNGQNCFDMSTIHSDAEFTISGNTVRYSYSINANHHDCVVKADIISLTDDDCNELTYANDTYRSWNGQNILFDAGYIPGVPAVKYETGNCYHNVLPGWWGYGNVTKAATYDAAGVRTYTCELCGKTKTETIAKLVPKKNDVVTIGKAKCKVTGSSTVSYLSPTSKSAKVKIPSSVTIGGKKYSVTSIAANAFKANKKITSVTIPNTVTAIDAQAFCGCISLKSIIIPASVKTIGKKAFYNCKKLKTIKIKSTKLTIKKVGAGAFGKINSAAKFKVSKSKLKLYKKLLKKKGVTGKKQKITK